ncbi:hypothetical protein CASFOL_021069 [Castilleja foliolosa]|uniref:Uncharacterized protein n=1 Tax=Castilleja foliolosa TaxID=1961234 RepID=A0ABD3CZB5_9LAMI
MATIRRMDELAAAGGGGGQLNRRKVFSTAGAWTKVEQVSGCWAPIWRRFAAMIDSWRWRWLVNAWKLDRHIWRLLGDA